MNLKLFCVSLLLAPTSYNAACQSSWKDSLEFYFDYTFNTKEDYEKRKSFERMPGTAFDSARMWLSEVNSYKFERDFISGYSNLRTILINSGNKFFYRLSDSAIAANLIASTSFDSLASGSIHIDDLVMKLKTALIKMKEISTPFIEDQIWDEDYKFTINTYNQSLRIKEDLNDPLVKQVQDWNINGQSDSIRYLMHHLYFMDNEKKGIPLLFKLLTRYLNHPVPFVRSQYVRELADSIVNKCTNSDQLSNLEKAKWILGCSKSLATTGDMLSENVVETYQYLKLAEGYASLSKADSSYLKKILYIQIKHSIESDQKWVKENMLYMNHIFYEYHLKTNTDEDLISSNLYHIGKKLTDHWDNFQLRNQFSQRKIMSIAATFKHLDNSIGRLNELNDVTLHYLLLQLAEYYRQTLQFEKALKISYEALDLVIHSVDPITRLKLIPTAANLALMLKDQGDYRDALLIFSTIDTSCWFCKHYSFVVPRDARLWTNFHYKLLQDSLRYVRVSDVWFHNDRISVGCISKNINMDLPLIFRKIARHEMKLGNIADAEYFFSKADSTMTHMEFPAPIIHAQSSSNREMAGKMLTQQELRYQTKLKWIFSIGLLIIGILGFTAIVQFYKAKLESRYSRYKSKIWQELGHIPGPSIDETYIKLKNAGASKIELSYLLELKGLIGDLFSNLAIGQTLKGNEYKNELELVFKYIRYKNQISESNIQLKATEYSILLPPALLLSSIRNAIVSGKLLDSDKGMIGIELKETKRYNVLHIRNNGNRFEKDRIEIDKLQKKSTGLRNMRTVLRHYNGWLDWTNPVLAGNIYNDPNGYTFETVLKIRKRI